MSKFSNDQVMPRYMIIAVVLTLIGIAIIGKAFYIMTAKKQYWTEVADRLKRDSVSVKPKTILIIGGKDKGNDYAPIIPLVKEKCAGLVYLGADNQKLHDNFDALGIPVRDTHSMKECIQACYEMAEPGMTVLLSPCCASFDLFKNMEDRGEQFKELARNL